MNLNSDINNFNKLYNEYNDRFIRFAFGYVRDIAVSEDFVSEAFVLYWENIHKLEPDTNPPAYILTIIKNKCLNYLKQQQTHNRIAEELKKHSDWVTQTKINNLEACDPDLLFREEIQTIINETLNRLPKRTRKIFLLNRNDGFSYEEIAEKMNLSIKSIEYHISKVLSQMRVSLKDFI